MLGDLANFVGRVSDRTSSIALFTICVFIVFGLIDVLLDQLTLQMVDADVHTAVQACLVGLFAAGVALVFLTARRERRRMLREEIDRVVQLNHQLRNALQVISHAHYSETDENHKRMMFDTVRTMETTLRELFPVLGVERRKHVRPRLQHT